MAYLEKILSQEKKCDGIWKEYKAEFIKHGFDTESTLRFLQFKDLTERVQMKLGEARLLWSVLVKRGLCIDSKCPMCGSHVKSAPSNFDKSTKDMNKALPHKQISPVKTSTASTKVSDEDPNMPNSTNTTVPTITTAPALPTPTSCTSFMHKSNFDGMVKHLMKNCKQGYGPYPIQATRSTDAVGTADDILFNAKSLSTTSSQAPSQGGQWWKFDFGKDFRVDPAKYVWCSRMWVFENVTLLTHDWSYHSLT